MTDKEESRKMTFKELEALMVKHGAVIRAITENERIIVEKRHADQFPNAKIKFLPEFNREMLVEVKPCKHGGQFVLECIKHSGATVKFNGNHFFGSLDEVAEYLAGLEEV